MSTQPEALQLADALLEGKSTYFERKAAAELRRLHSVNAELVTELKKALNSLEYVQQTFPGNAGCGVRHERIQSAQAAIAKATGETK